MAPKLRGVVQWGVAARLVGWALVCGRSESRGVCSGKVTASNLFTGQDEKQKRSGASGSMSVFVGLHRGRRGGPG